ncbi:MAG: SCP2 sterol-binding domain-containing protein [Planctomycetes bacterium]|nr:SCP2 sterol-binding domain-containing protein [Planctomycetota bacterium]
MANASKPSPLTSTAALYGVLGPLFEEVAKGGGAGVAAAAQAKLILRFTFTEPAGVMVLNCRKTPIGVTCGVAGEARPDLDLALPAATLHRILGEGQRLAVAMSTGGLKVKGDVTKVMKLGAVLDAVAELYVARLAGGGGAIAGGEKKGGKG